jgi:hypothetical protein
LPTTVGDPMTALPVRRASRDAMTESFVVRWLPTDAWPTPHSGH